MILAMLLLMSPTPEARFEAGDPSAAVQLLEASPRPKDPVWRYNRGIAAHASGSMGKALADFEWLTTRDAEDEAVRVNRQLARLDRGVGDDAQAPFGQLSRLPSRSVMLLGLLCLVVAIARRPHDDALMRTARGIGTVCLLALLLHRGLLLADDRVVTRSEANLMERADAEGRTLMALPAGNLLSPLGEEGDWVHVRTGSGLLGFVRRSELLSLEGVQP